MWWRSPALLDDSARAAIWNKSHHVKKFDMPLGLELALFCAVRGLRAIGGYLQDRTRDQLSAVLEDTS